LDIISLSFQVYKVEDSKDNNKVYALKLIPAPNKEATDHAKKEAELMKKLDHPNVLRLYDSFTAPFTGIEHFCMLLEVCDGSLEHVIAKFKMSPQVIMGILVQVIEALEYLHSQTLIHRDIKVRRRRCAM